MINCVINYQNWEMSAKEISDTLIELQRRINNNEVSETDYKKYDLNSTELNYLINVLTDLNTYNKQQFLSPPQQRPTLPSQPLPQMSLSPPQQQPTLPSQPLLQTPNVPSQHPQTSQPLPQRPTVPSQPTTTRNFKIDFFFKLWS